MADDNKKGSRQSARDPWHQRNVTYFRLDFLFPGVALSDGRELASQL